MGDMGDVWRANKERIRKRQTERYNKNKVYIDRALYHYFYSEEYKTSEDKAFTKRLGKKLRLALQVS